MVPPTLMIYVHIYFFVLGIAKVPVLGLWQYLAQWVSLETVMITPTNTSEINWKPSCDHRHISICCVPNRNNCQMDSDRCEGKRVMEQRVNALAAT